MNRESFFSTPYLSIPLSSLDPSAKEKKRKEKGLDRTVLFNEAAVEIKARTKLMFGELEKKIMIKNSFFCFIIREL